MRDPNEYYLFLGTDPDAHSLSISVAYRSRLNWAQSKGGFLLEMIEEAFACLSDPSKRALYDTGKYPINRMIAAFRDILKRDGRLAEFDNFSADVKIGMYCEVLGAEDATVDLELQQDGSLMDTKTGEMFDVSIPGMSQELPKTETRWNAANSADPKGYYAHLGLKPTASVEEINRAYLDVIAKCSDNPMVLSMAYEAFSVLGSTQKRREYDGGSTSDLTSGKIALTVDASATPGAMMSGKIVFSDRQMATWFIDMRGKLMLAPTIEGYEPSKSDAAVFLGLVNDAINRHNRALTQPKEDHGYRTMGKPTANFE